MKSIQFRFKQKQKANPFLGDYINLKQAVRGQGFSRRRIYTAFQKLISRDDYEPLLTNTLIAQLHQASNDLEECTLLSEIEQLEDKFKEDDTDIKSQS